MLRYDHSQQIQPDDVRAEYTWIHGDKRATSNWLRYMNTPVSAAMENIAACQYKGMKFQPQVRWSVRKGRISF